jgi:hypothetical protein
MSFPLGDVPQSLMCFASGHKIIKDLSLTERFEVLVALEVQGRLAASRNAGFDVYNSILYPDLTFQVKASHAWKDPGTDAKKRNRSKIYTFRGSIEHMADYYVLFGVRGDLVFPFVLMRESWERFGSKAGKFRVLIISAERYSRKTKALKENRLWNCYVSDWPEGVHRRLGQHQLTLL